MTRMSRREQEEEFENKYQEYKRLVDKHSGGLVETNKADFIKIGAYMEVVVMPLFTEMNKEHYDGMRDLIRRM